MKYSLWLAIMFAFCPTLVSGQVVEHHEMVAESATASSFQQKLDRRVKRFDTAGRTLVASIVELAFTYQLPTAIEYADREAATRQLNLHFQNESVRRILEAITEQVPGYSVSFSGGIVDVFAARGREDPSNLLNTVIKKFEVSELDTDRADMELFCALSHEIMPSGGCGGSHPGGQWGPLKITLHLHNAKVYEVLNALVAENGKAIWTVIRSPDELSKLQASIWYIYPLEHPFKAAVSEELEHPKLQVERQLTKDEVESLRKRNECEQRFYDDKIHEVDGMSLVAACKQNPERRP
jgi:hypothetical protein